MAQVAELLWGAPMSRGKGRRRSGGLKTSPPRAECDHAYASKFEDSIDSKSLECEVEHPVDVVKRRGANEDKTNQKQSSGEGGQNGAGNSTGKKLQTTQGANAGHGYPANESQLCGLSLGIPTFING